MIDEFNLDEILSEGMQDQVLNRKRQKTGPDSELSRGSESTKSGSSAKPIQENEFNQIRAQMYDQCLNGTQSSQNLLLIKAQNANVFNSFQSELVSTRLADLKEMCHCVLANYLTVGDAANAEKVEREFFKHIVAERYPDLFMDICDFWLSQIYYKVPICNDQSDS